MVLVAAADGGMLMAVDAASGCCWLELAGASKHCCCRWLRLEAMAA